MIGRSGVPNWILETLFWLDEKDSLENIKLQTDGKKTIMKSCPKSLVKSLHLL